MKFQEQLESLLEGWRVEIKLEDEYQVILRSEKWGWFLFKGETLDLAVSKAYGGMGGEKIS